MKNDKNKRDFLSPEEELILELFGEYIPPQGRFERLLDTPSRGERRKKTFTKQNSRLKKMREQNANIKSNSNQKDSDKEEHQKQKKNQFEYDRSTKRRSDCLSARERDYFFGIDDFFNDEHPDDQFLIAYLNLKRNLSDIATVEYNPEYCSLSPEIDILFSMIVRFKNGKKYYGIDIYDKKTGILMFTVVYSSHLFRDITPLVQKAMDCI